MDVFLVLELLLIGELRHRLLVLAVKLLDCLLYSGSGRGRSHPAACADGLIVGAVVGLEVAFRPLL